MFAMLALAVLVLLALAASASAKLAAITGRLSKPGYTVVALGYNGKAAIARPGTRPFRLTPPDSRVTLQLVDRHGKYAGPVVVAVTGKGSKAMVGVKAGAKLGTIRVLSGYAKLAKPLANKSLDKRRWAQARRGMPIGNGRNFGLVRSRVHTGPSGPGGDGARTGVPNALSIDADGDGMIDALKPSGPAKARIAQAPAPGGSSGFQIFSQLLPGGLADTVNADASTISTAQIDAAMARWDTLGMQVLPGDVTNLDCGGLSYCTAGGTGHEYVYPGSGLTPTCTPSGPATPPGCNYNEGPAFPACCDKDGDGLGDLPQGGEPGQSGGFALLPEATSTQIGSGDVLIERVTSAGVVTQVPSSLSFVYETTPALSSWSSGSDSATVSYPVARGGPGTQTNPWPIGGGAGDVVITFTFWRPQRAGIAGAGEPAFMDIGHLNYFSRPFVLASGPGGSGGSQPFSCPASSYSTSDPNLVVTTSGPEAHVVDQANDAPSNPANTLTYSLDLTTCLAANSVTLASGNVVQVDISGRDPSGSGDNTGQNLVFKLR